MIQKIIINNTENTIQILRRDVHGGDSYDVDPHFWTDLAMDDNIISLVSSGDLIINNGNQNLDTTIAIEHIRNPAGVIFSHRDIILLPISGYYSPSYVIIPGDVAVGHSFEIGDKVYGQTRVDNIVGDFLKIEFHFAINNNELDRWIKFRIKWRTTTGSDNKILNQQDGTLDTDLIEVPEIEYKPFKYDIQIPVSSFSNDEKYIIFSIERILIQDKTSPINDPIVWRYCKKYWKKVS